MSLLTVLLISPAAADSLDVLIESAVAAIVAQPAGQRLTQLSDLELMVNVQAHCKSGFEAESVSISVADTRRVIGNEALVTVGGAETTMRVPSRQIAPVALPGFCGIDDSSQDHRESILLPAVLTAQVSLRCSSESESSIHFDTVAIDVNVGCELPDDPSEGAAVGQEGSSPVSF